MNTSRPQCLPVLGILAILLSLQLSGCSKEKYFEGPDAYQDDFESYAVFDDLFEEDDSRWSYSQITLGPNDVRVDTSRAHSGSQSMRFVASQRIDGETVSKASVAKQKMAFWEGETVHLEAWYYLEGNAPHEWLFLMDLEEQATIGAGPGMRVALVGNALLVEHKYPQPNLAQQEGAEVAFPRDQWVHIALEVTLSQSDEGRVRLWQDGVLLISQDEWQTLPKDILYAQQGTKAMYSSVEFGATANASEEEATLWVDDVAVYLVP